MTLNRSGGSIHRSAPVFTSTAYIRAVASHSPFSSVASLIGAIISRLCYRGLEKMKAKTKPLKKLTIKRLFKDFPIGLALRVHRASVADVCASLLKASSEDLRSDALDFSPNSSQSVSSHAQRSQAKLHVSSPAQIGSPKRVTKVRHAAGQAQRLRH